jgi:hypothetical protein
MLTSKSGIYGTPTEIYDWLDRLMPFTVDAAADETNHKHARWWGIRENFFAQDLTGETFFLNPVYGRQIGEFIAHAREGCLFAEAQGCLVIPARVDAKWWKNLIMQRDGEAGRLLSAWYDPLVDVLWFRWELLIVAVRFHDQRLIFEGDGNEGGDSAPFPTAFVFMSSTARARPPRFGGAPMLDLLRMWPRR